MEKVFVKLEQNGERVCFAVDTARTATELDKSIRPFIANGVLLTCLREKGAKEYGWNEEAIR